MKSPWLRLSSFVKHHPFWALTLSLVCAGLLQGRLATSKTTITHDETISYLSAIGRQGEFENMLRHNLYPANHWVPASEWKAWFTIDQPFSFRQIGLDLAESDIHPPLYFWFLHIWIWLFGVHAWTGPTLNIFFLIIGAVGLFFLARHLLRNDFEALSVVFLWSISPSLLATVFEARQYLLLGVCTIFFIWLMIVITEKEIQPRWLHWGLLALATAAGALTHYHFVLVVAGAGLIFVLRWLRLDFRRVVLVGTAVAAGYILSFILHPQFYQSVQELSRRQVLEAENFNGWLAFVQRSYIVARIFTGFWTAFSVAQLLLFCVALASLIWVGLVLWRRPQQIKIYLRGKNLEGYEAVLFFSWMAGISILLYLTYVSPIHAMTERHMNAVWPFFPFGAILLLRLLKPEQRIRGTVLLVTAVLISSLYMIRQQVWASNEVAWNEVGPELIDRAIVDGVYQGILPRVLFRLPDNALVYVADQEELLAEADSWLPLLEKDSIYISELSYDNTEANRDKILALIEQNFALTTHVEEDWEVGTRYFISPQN